MAKPGAVMHTASATHTALYSGYVDMPIMRRAGGAGGVVRGIW